ncbi:MAG: hypothetical protein JWP12_1371 [Bacteroidetes bacterium]|nr:hypothetical protein [Bacteroidota bacterium]
MKKNILLIIVLLCAYLGSNAQSCAFDRQITTTDSVLCAGDSTMLTFNVIAGAPVDTVVPTPIVNNNGQDGNMFDITATNTIRIRYFEGLIANIPNPTTEYYIYYKVGTLVGSETNSAAWTMLAGPITVTPNAPNAYTIIPVTVNIVIPAGQTYAFYLTNTAAASNNNRYHNGTATGATLAGNADLTIFEGTGGAYPFGTFFNARPWEGIVHYDYPPVTYLWSTGATTSSIMVNPAATADYSCIAAVTSLSCSVEDTITVQVNPLPALALHDTAICQGNNLTIDAGNAGASYTWCSGQTTQSITAGTAGMYCVSVTNANGCTNADSLTLSINALPSVTASGDTVCAGTAGTLTGNGTGTMYTWNPGALTGASVTDMPSVTTTYTATATDLNGCSDTASATIYVNALPVVVTTGSTICQGDSATVTVTGSSATYTWTPGAVNGGSLSDAPASTSTYTVTALGANGCSATGTATITVNPLPAISVSSFGTYCIYNPDVTLSGASPAGGVYSGAGISGNTLSPAAAGTGTHMIVYSYTDANGCSNADSASVIIDVCTGIVSQQAAQNIHIYPNPFSTSTTLTVDAGVVLKDATFQLYDITGKKVLEQIVSGSTVSIQRGQLDSGVYFYRLMNNGILAGSGKLIAE